MEQGGKRTSQLRPDQPRLPPQPRSAAVGDSHRVSRRADQWLGRSQVEVGWSRAQTKTYN